jgi:hypothetical protein
MRKNNKINQLVNTKLWFVIFMFLGFNSIAQDTADKDYVFEICDKVNNPDSQVGNFSADSLASLPIGIRKEIAGTTYIIAIDSAEFTPTGAYFNAYMAMEFPGCDERIAFAAKHIKFNPKGVLGGEQAKLALVSEHRIAMGPNSTLYLPKDGSNYVEWDCNGFKAVNLHGAFLFNKEKLIPVNDTVVAADFQVHVTDIHNMMAAVTFNEFEIKGLKDFTFTINEAYVDMSDFNNPAGIVYPQDYVGVDVGTPNLWRGFYLKSFSVKLPENLNKDGQDDMTIFGQNMIIDDAGVSGLFGVTSLFSTDEGSTDGWGFSIDLLSVKLNANQLTGGNMSGNIAVPALKDQELQYGALISTNPVSKTTEYNFNMGIENDIVKEMSIIKADLTIKNTSKLNMHIDDRGKFKPTLVLNGDLTLDYENLELDKLAFQDITFTSDAPYLTNGIFSLTSSNPSSNDQDKMGKYPVSLTELGFNFNNSTPTFEVGVALNLGDPGANGISAATNVFMKMRVDENASTREQNWQFDGFQVNTIHLGLFTNAFTFEGIINFRNDDPVYGKGFSGGFQLGIPAVFDDKMAMACAFGKVDGYKYWMVDATLPVIIPIGPVTLTSVSGGLAYHMSGEKTTAEMIAEVAEGGIVASQESSMDYIPNQDMGIIFKAGVGFKNTAKEETLNGDVAFSIAFNSNGGLNNVQFFGEAYMLTTRENRATATDYVKGNISVLFDNQEKIFDLSASLEAEFADAITGTMWTKIYISPNEWYFWLGRPDNPATIEVANLASATAYFMLGQNLLPMPPPPPQVVSVANQTGNQRNSTDIASGDGVAMGLNFEAGFNSAFNISDRLGIYGTGYAGAGFDMTLYKYATSTHCQGSTDEFGMNYWYLQGQLYAYMGLEFGCSWVKKNGDIAQFEIMNANASMLLQGKLPNPAYVYGAVHLNARFLAGVVKVNVNADIEFGDNCTIVN